MGAFPLAVQSMDTAFQQEVPPADDAAADVVSAVQRQHIIRFHQRLQAVGHMLLTDSDRAVRQLLRHIGKFIVIMRSVAIAVVADRIDDELLRDAFIIVEAIECRSIVLRAVMLQLGQTEPDEVPNGAVEGADVVKVCLITADALLAVAPRVHGRAEDAKHFVIKGVPLFQICLARMEQVKRSIFAALGDLIRHALKLFVPLILRQLTIFSKKQIELSRDLPYDREESILALVQQQMEHGIAAQRPAERCHLFIQFPPKRDVPALLIFLRKTGDPLHAFVHGLIFVRRQVQQIGGQHTGGELLTV